MANLNTILQAIVEKGSRLIEPTIQSEPPEKQIRIICDKLLSSKGEASGVALADQTLRLYRELTPDEQLSFFEYLATEYNPSPEEVLAAAQDYQADQTSDKLKRLTHSCEPLRQELFRRLNFAPRGTYRLVKMREDLIRFVRSKPELKRIDDDLRHLLSSWFNRGFLTLRPINWDSPARELEKLIAYEAVHEIKGWDDLRRRTDPPDRRCFAFFHPTMPEEPLVFVEVALTDDIPNSIQELLRENRVPSQPTDKKFAVFYSISNCQAGLKGVSFGAFLIKQVVTDLSRELPNLKLFLTLSPVPGFMKSLEEKFSLGDGNDDVETLRAVLKNAAAGKPLDEDMSETVRKLAADYLANSKQKNGAPKDPVARFHLGNGACLHAVHTNADLSKRGMQNASGVMVNYLYDLDKLEARHEAFKNDGSVALSRDVSALISAMGKVHNVKKLSA
ncbi:malonyl-CoA decarboxylase family protein [Pseudohalocynthiibacter sp. F2068]|uniref:malonyl-CoA decarboxylase domain-containing protein n=1 Tax=Pseudohalocynthiibacter sp. F2068 TaxID=2926418 RepID=UPI001FF4DBFB|nr:malonyl-CoA decarboxylase family protein [Pseudohalocynthiibacter sp. F2068]MCK0104579.1 malonyl-CoA decarboxylase [Pseudohalocynthiibacter sp. F2068]